MTTQTETKKTGTKTIDCGTYASITMEMTETTITITLNTKPDKTEYTAERTPVAEALCHAIGQEALNIEYNARRIVTMRNSITSDLERLKSSINAGYMPDAWARCMADSAANITKASTKMVAGYNTIKKLGHAMSATN